MSVIKIDDRAAAVGTASPDRAVSGALVAVGLAALLAVMDGTVVAVALERLSGSLDAALSTVVWATIGYLLAAASMLPLLGWAGARFGQRRVFLAGLGLFVVGSLLCATAWSAPALIAFRFVQGFGGGLLEPMALTLAAGLASPRTVGRVLGIMSMIINAAPVLGPVVGGLLLQTGHWQWLFLVNVPFGVVVLGATLAFVPADPPAATADRPRADLRGLAMLTVGYVAVLFALNRYGTSGAGAVVVAPAGAGVVLLAGYTRHALTAREITPALDLRLLGRGRFAVALVVMAMVGLIMYSMLTSLPLFAQSRHGLHGVAQGVVVTALGLGLIVSMTVGGRLSDRAGPRPLARAGSVVTCAGLAVFAAWHDDLPLYGVLALFLGVGLGFGLCAAPTFASVYRVLSPEQVPQGTTALFITVQLAASLGVALLGVLQTTHPGDWLTALFATAAAAAAVIHVLSYALPGAPPSE